jgi:hypothetical protein
MITFCMAFKPYSRGYAVLANIRVPSMDLLKACDDGVFPSSYHHRNGVVVYLPRLMNGDGGHSWDPLLEEDSGSRAPRVGFGIPKQLDTETVEDFKIETLEIGSTTPEGYIDFGFVATSVRGQAWGGHLKFPSENINDWHRDSSGRFATRNAVGRVGITDTDMLSIDEADLQLHADKGVAIVQSNSRLESFQVGSVAPALPSRLADWQLAVNALYERIGCGGCESLHYALSFD